MKFCKILNICYEERSFLRKMTLENPFSGSRKWKGLSFAATLIALSAVVLAWNVTWNAPISLVIESIDLKVYLEQNCTTPVTTIDFGNIETVGTWYTKYLYIRNEGVGPVRIRWNSTRASVTDLISDHWQYYVQYSGYFDISGYTLSANAVFATQYRMNVSHLVDPGSYSWTLYLGAEHY